MEIKEFIATLEKMNFSLSVKEGKLILKGDRKKLSPGEIDAIKSNKEIIDFIKGHKQELIDHLSLFPDLFAKTNAKNIGSVYRLSGLQQGMLFHGLYNENSGSYVEQISCDLLNVNRDVLLKSWAEVIKRHTALRSAFYYDSFSVPVQCVCNEVNLPVEDLDYREIDEVAQTAKLKEYEAADRLKSFDFKSPPLMRIGLIRLDERRYHMVWTSHHILYDGWSTPILMGELLNTYEYLISGQTVPNAVEDKYEDYIRYLERRDEHAEEQYWRNYLKGTDNGTLLPFINASADRTKGFGRHQLHTAVVDENIAARVQEYVKYNHITVNTLIQGVWAWLIAYYTNNSDVVYGTVVSGRPDDLPGVEQRVGMYINTLPLKASINENQDTVKWLQSLQEDQISSRQYQYAALHDIQQWTNAKKDLFDSLLIFENYPVSKLLTSKKWLLQVENVQFQEQTNYPLTVMVTSAKKLTITFNYNADLLEKTYIIDIQKHFEKVLLQIIDGDAETLKDIKPLTVDQEVRLLHSFNGTSAGYPKGKSVVKLFEDQVKKTPSATAAVFGKERLSYEELNKRSNQLARYLQKRGVIAETIVPICLERSIEMIVGILGILKAGAAYVPIDPEYPEERIRYMLEDTGATLLLTSAGSHDKLNVSLPVITLDTDWHLIEAEQSEDLQTVIAPGSLAYVIYTSGSTGLPKGVMIEHDSLTNRLNWAQNYFKVSSRDNILQKTTFCFDVSVWELLLPLLSGAGLVFIKPGGQTDNEYLKDIIAAEKITMVHFVPSMLSAFLPDVKAGDCQSLKNVICSGEALNPAQAELFRIKLPHAQLTNLYGPTEAAIDVSYWSLPNDGKPVSAVPIGKPVDNTQLYILNKQGKPVPIGVEGELFIGGVQVARGYMNRAELTAGRFIKDPFSDNLKARLYRTGDLAKWLPDGNIAYLGRMDDQVKIRGYRIELGEIESVLEKSGQVIQCVVSAREDTQGNKRLTGYVVPKGEFDKQAIQAYLQEKLPEYMVPALWVVMDSIPLTSNGKANRKALPDIENGELSAQEYVAPGNKTEIELAEIWQELLGIERVGIHDNFFELGGHSLSAMRLVSAVRRQMQKELSIKQVFTNPTIALLSTCFDQISTNNLQLPVITLQARPAKIPLSYSQERLWFIDKLGGSSQYHIPSVLRLSGDTDVAALSYALNTVISRHEILRTVYGTANGQAFQYIKAANNWELNIVRLEIAEQEENRLKARINQLINKPFDLSKDDMLRADLLVLNSKENVLVLTLHHIASDGWSASVLVAELVVLYNSFKEKKAELLPQLPIQYADYALWQRKYLTDEILDKKIAYWKQKLDGISPLQLPTDNIRPSIQSNHGAAINFSMDTTLSMQLNQLSKTAGVTLFMTLLSAFKVLLYRYSSQEDICVGTPTAGRQQKELEGLMGFFVNTLTLRSQVTDEMTFSELLSSIKQTTLEAYEHQEVPFEKVVDAVIHTRDMSRSPLFQVIFILQNTPDIPQPAIGGVTLSTEQYQQTTSQFELSLSMVETPDGLRGSIAYNTHLYYENTINQLIGHFKELLKAIVSQPSQKVGLLTMLSATEEQQLLHSFNATSAGYPKGKSVVKLFEEQVKRTPSATAAVFGKERLSYEELNKRSNQLARYLQKRGVIAETIVPICLERSIEMIVGILGILKAGAAYVPIDPEYPEERIRYMLEDTGATLLLTSAGSHDKLNVSLPVITLDTDWHLIEAEQSEDLQTVISPGSLAYVIYTSGSTGLPKGVMIEHDSLTNRLNWAQNYFKVSSRDNILQKTTFCFDVSVWELLLPLLSGAGLVFIKPGGQTDNKYLRDIIAAEKITMVHFVPSMLSAFLPDVKAGDCQSLKNVICSGEALNPAQAELFRIKLPHAQLTNLYGPTEAAIDVSYWSLPNDGKPVSAVPIGKPVDNTQLYILNKQGKPVPIGVEGELFIGGVQVARGYMNRAELTAGRFIKDPFSDNLKARLYRTGDLAKWLPDGNIAYLGRMDDQVKIRGYRIELGEIESVLEKSGLVIQCVVSAREDTQGNKRLTGYVVPKGEFDKQAIQAYLQEKLPEYMVPALWVVMDSIPLTSNGKANRKALPDIENGELSAQEYVAPGNKTEIELAEIWQELLGIERVGIHDNFFELGGHSLLVMRVASYIELKLLVSIPIHILFQLATINELGKYIELKINPEHQEENSTSFKFLDV